MTLLHGISSNPSVQKLRVRPVTVATGERLTAYGLYHYVFNHYARKGARIAKLQIENCSPRCLLPYFEDGHPDGGVTPLKELSLVILDASPCNQKGLHNLLIRSIGLETLKLTVSAVWKDFYRICESIPTTLRVLHLHITTKNKNDPWGDFAPYVGMLAHRTQIKSLGKSQ